MPTKARLVEAVVLPVVTYGCESWTIEKAWHQRTDVFQTGGGEDFFFFFIQLQCAFIFYLFFIYFIYFLFVVNFVIH